MGSLIGELEARAAAAQARDRDHVRTWAVLADGARHQLDLIRAEADRRGITV